MNRHALLPLAVFFIGAGFVLAGTAPTPVARSFPWAGFLEENGVAVTGHREIGIDLFTVAQQGTACGSTVFADVEVAAGRFHVVFESVPEACLIGGALYFDMSVGPVGGPRTTLAAASGNHTRLHAVPFASANDRSNRFVVGSGGRLVFERDGGQTSVTTRNGQTGVNVQPDSALTNGQAVFTVRDAGGTERLRVESNNRVQVNEKIEVTGAATFSSTLAVGAASTFASDVAVSGVLSAAHASTVARVLFPSAGGANNDQGSIEHVEDGNTSELWLSSSDDWRNNDDTDRIIFGDRGTNMVQHEFDGAGNAVHRGDLTVGGAVSSTCPSGMTFVAGWCIDNGLGNGGAVENYAAAIRICHNRGKMLCPYDALAACDEIDPSSSSCTAKTRDGATLWSSTRHSERDDHNESWRENLMCFRNAIVDECTAIETHDYFCCTHAYTGAP